MFTVLFDMAELAALLPEKYRDEIEKYHSAVFTVSQMNEVTNDLDEYDRDMAGKAMAILEPPSIDHRIVNQYSFFSVVPNGMDDIEKFLDKYTQNTYKYIISKDIRWELRDILDQLNISERIVYPGLDGLTKWIGRHYYVKEKK